MRLLLATIFAALTVGFGAELRAQTLPPVFCNGLVGCDSAGGSVDPANIIFGFTLPAIIMLLINLAGAGSIIFIIVAGAQMMLSNGDEGKTTQARWGIFYALAGLLLAVTSQALVEFVATENYGQADGPNFLFGGFLPAVVRIALLLVNVTFTIVIIMGGIRLVTAGGSSDEFQKGLSVIRWSITGAVVINLARALVEALLNLNL